MIKFEHKIKTQYTSVDEFFHPSQGESCTIPNGFGVNNNNYIKSNKTNCLIYNWMIEDNILNFSTKTGLIIRNSAETYEKYIYFLSLIFSNFIIDSKKISSGEKNNAYTSHSKRIKYSEENPDVPIVFFHMTEKAEYNIFEQMLGMSSQYVKAMVNFFIRHDFLTIVDDSKYMINWAEGESISDRKSRSFIVDHRIYRTPKQFFFTNERIKKNLKNKLNSEVEEALRGDEFINFENKLYNDESIGRYTFPSMERLVEVADKMVKEGATDKRGRRYVWEIGSEYLHPDNGKEILIKLKNGTTKKHKIKGKLIENCPVVDIKIHLYSYYMWMSGSKVLKERKKYEYNGVTFYDRFYSILSVLPKWIRAEILIDGEETVEVDATALHSRIVGKLYADTMECEVPFFLTGDSHTKVAEMLDITRAEAKLIALSYWNSRIVKDATISSKKNKHLFEKMDAFLKKDFHDLWRYLKYIKCKMDVIKGKGYHRNSNMSALLVDMETIIMQDLIERLNRNELVPCIYVYDAIAVKKSKAEEVKKLLEKVLYYNLEV